MHAGGRLAKDYAETLDMLNDGRKVAVYEGEESDLGSASLEELFVDVGAAVVVAEETAR